MKRYVIRRLLLAIPLLLAISFICFVFINLIPSNPAEVALRVQQMPLITEEAIAEMEEMLGLNKPFMIRYLDWVLGSLQGDFGISYVNPARTVAGELARCLPATLQLTAVSFVIVLVLSVPIGFLCAVYKDGWFDKITRAVIFVSTAMPAYWAGLLLMWGISVKLDLLPTSGSGTWKHLILPSFTVALSYISTYTARCCRERRDGMLELNNICVSFRSERQDKIFGHTRQQVLFDVSLRVEKGTCLGILGESGSGKSTMGRVLCGLLKPDSGEVQLDGVSVYASRAGRRNLQNKLSVVFQDYTTSANPRFRVKDIIGEGLTVRERREGRKRNRESETASLLELVGLSADFAGRFPHELSGGQLQRVCIARAVACNPEIILFDEAISSLDAHTQVQVMDLLLELKEKLGLTYIFITHDLTSITYLCDDVLFLYQGHVTEYMPVSRISQTRDAYARRLLESIVVFHSDEEVAV